jgi:hypothetical protein
MLSTGQGTTSMKFSLVIIAVLSIASCSQSTGDAQEVSHPHPEDQDTPPVQAQAQAQAPTEISFARNAQVDESFAGEAAGFMQRNAQPAAADLIEASSEAVRNEARLAGCRPSPAKNQVFSVDLDGDGHNEGLAIYSIACNGGRNPTRILAVLRQDKQLHWKPILQSAISVTPGANRSIIELRPGEIILAGEQAPNGERMPPEAIEIPAVGQEMEAGP